MKSSRYGKFRSSVPRLWPRPQWVSILVPDGHGHGHHGDASGDAVMQDAFRIRGFGFGLNGAKNGAFEPSKLPSMHQRNGPQWSASIVCIGSKAASSEKRLRLRV